MGPDRGLRGPDGRRTARQGVHRRHRQGCGRRRAWRRAARFYAAEAAKVLQAYFHAAALTGRTLDDVLRWVANPAIASEPTEILREHPHAAPFWHGLLHGALHGDDRTAGNTITTVQQAMSLFFQDDIRRRCVPGARRPATDMAEVIRRGGTIYLLGREDPYASASPLMTAVAEHVLDTALLLANQSPWGRLCPPLLACLDELPSTAPLPTLRTRMANERPGDLLHLRRPDLAAAHRGLRRARSPRPVRADQRPGHLRRLQGRRVQPGDLRPARPIRVARTQRQTGAMAGRTFSGKATGKQLDLPVVHVWDVRDGKIARFRQFADTAKFREVVAAELATTT